MVGTDWLGTEGALAAGISDARDEDGVDGFAGGVVRVGDTASNVALAEDEAATWGTGAGAGLFPRLATDVAADTSVGLVDVATVGFDVSGKTVDSITFEDFAVSFGLAVFLADSCCCFTSSRCFSR